MKKLKEIKAFTIIELLIVTVILAILLLIVPNLDLFVENAIKKEGVLLTRTIIEQERVYKADNGDYFFVKKGSNDYKKIQNWKTIENLLIDNKYFIPEKDVGGELKFDNTEQVIVSVSTNSAKQLEVEVKASPKSKKAAGWHVRGRLIEGTNITDKKGKPVPNKIVFEECKAKDIEGDNDFTDWIEISL